MCLMFDATSCTFNAHHFVGVAAQGHGRGSGGVEADFLMPYRRERERKKRKARTNEARNANAESHCVARPDSHAIPPISIAQSKVSKHCLLTLVRDYNC